MLLLVFWGLTNHSGIHSYGALKPSNVGGTIALLRLACDSRQKAFHYISTMSVLSNSELVPHPEDVDLASIDPRRLNGYGYRRPLKLHRSSCTYPSLHADKANGWRNAWFERQAAVACG